MPDASGYQLRLVVEGGFGSSGARYGLAVIPLDTFNFDSLQVGMVFNWEDDEKRIRGTVAQPLLSRIQPGPERVLEFVLLLKSYLVERFPLAQQKLKPESLNNLLEALPIIIDYGHTRRAVFLNSLRISGPNQGLEVLAHGILDAVARARAKDSESDLVLDYTWAEFGNTGPINKLLDTRPAEWEENGWLKRGQA